MPKRLAPFAAGLAPKREVEAAGGAAARVVDPLAGWLLPNPPKSGLVGVLVFAADPEAIPGAEEDPKPATEEGLGAGVIEEVLAPVDPNENGDDVEAAVVDGLPNRLPVAGDVELIVPAAVAGAAPTRLPPDGAEEDEPPNRLPAAGWGAAAPNKDPLAGAVG